MGSYQIWKWFATILCDFACEYVNCEQGPNEQTTDGATGLLTVAFHHIEQPKAIISFPLKNNATATVTPPIILFFVMSLSTEDAFNIMYTA